MLLKLGALSEDDLANEMSTFVGCARLEPNSSLRNLQAPELPVTDSFLRAHQLVALAADESSVTVVCWDPLDDYAAKALVFACGRPITWVIATRTQIEQALDASDAAHSATPESSLPMSSARISPGQAATCVPRRWDRSRTLSHSSRG
ncbi:MAG: hypothetical protein ACREV5_23750, partial [Steroidobacter sp.]